MVMRMMNATDEVLNTAMEEAATTVTTVVRAITAGEIVSAASAGKGDETLVVRRAPHRAMACATLEKVAEVITVVITKTCLEVGWDGAAAALTNTGMAPVGARMVLLPGAGPWVDLRTTVVAPISAEVIWGTGIVAVKIAKTAIRDFWIVFLKCFPRGSAVTMMQSVAGVRERGKAAVSIEDEARVAISGQMTASGTI
jgi:hypothetical protein